MSWEKEDPRTTHPYAAGRWEGLGKRASDPNSHRSRLRNGLSRLSRTISGSTGLDRFSSLSPTLSDNDSAYANALSLLASSSIATTTATGSPISASELPNLPVTPTPTRRPLSREFSISSSYTYNSGTDYSHSTNSAAGSVDGSAAGSCSKYSNVSEILATASTAAAVGGSPTATSSVIGNSRRASLSSTIRKFWLETTGSDSSLAQSRTSLASSARSNRHSTHFESDMRVSDWQLPAIDEPVDGMPEEEEEGEGRRGEEKGPECMSESGEDLPRVERNEGHLSQHVRTASHSRDRLRIPVNLHPLQTKFSSNSLSTVESVALAGTWDGPSATSLTPITIFSCKDDGLSDYKEDSPASEMMCVEEPVNQAITLPKNQAVYGTPSPTDPLNKLGKELAIVDQLLGYLDFSEVMQLQLVCKYWKDVLRSREIYHTFIRQNYRYVVPGPGDMRVARTFADLQRIEKQNRAIKEGHLIGLTQIELKGLSPRVYYHSGYACYNQADTMERRGPSNHQIILYNFLRCKKGEPETYLYPSSPKSKIMFTMLGGGACSGIHLAYGEINPDSSTSVSCYLVPSREAKWRRPLPRTIVLDENDRAIAQTNALVTAVAVKNRIVAWDQYGNLIGDTELPPQQANIQNEKAGNIFLSRDKIYLVTWSSQAPAWVSIYSNRTLKCLVDYQLGSGSAKYVSGSVTDNKLYLAVASPKDQDLSGLYSTWQLLCVDDSSLGVPQPIPDFPTFDHVAHVRFVYYPHHGRTYMTSHTDPSAGHWDPSYILTVVDNSSGRSTCVKRQTGYPTRFWLDGDVPHWDSLQGDNEFMIWCTRGAMKVFRFKT